jgi:flagellar basal-body rod protein FlgG
MDSGYYAAAAGLASQHQALDVVAHNLANLATTGYRGQQTTFRSLLTGHGGVNANPLNAAINNFGMLQVLLPDGQTAYTRAGNFELDAQGNLVTQDGNPVQPSISIPTGATSITVGSDGTVSVTLAGQTAAQTVGTIQLALFNNPGGLNSTGSNLFLQTTASGDPIVGAPGGTEGLGSVIQGMLEQSNVSVVTEFVNMIVAQRSYEASSKVVSAADQMLQTVNNLGR